MECVISTHHAHSFTKLEDILQGKRASLQKELQDLETNSLTEWQNLLKKAKQTTADFSDQIDGIERELEERAKVLHKEVEMILENNKAQLREMKMSMLAILQEQEKRVSDGLEKVKERIRACEDKLRHGDKRSLFEHENTRDTNETLPGLSHVMPSAFTPSQIDTESLSEMFGILTIPRTTQGADSPSHSPPSNISQHSKKSVMKEEAETTDEPAHSIGETTHAEDEKMSDSADAAPTEPLHQLMPESSVESQFEVKCHTLSFACVGAGQAWVRTASNSLQLRGRYGIVKDTIVTDFGFSGMFVSQQGDFLFADHKNTCIKSILRTKTFFSTKQTVKTLFNTKWTPNSLYCLHSGDIAVTFLTAGRVLIYSTSGNIIKELGNELLRHPFRVVQSKINDDLYISDKKDTIDSVGKVLALDKDYKVRFEYTGQDNKKSFDPRGLCTDYVGNVLITDFYNDRVHILDKDGGFLKVLVE